MRREGGRHHTLLGRRNAYKILYLITAALVCGQRTAARDECDKIAAGLLSAAPDVIGAGGNVCESRLLAQFSADMRHPDLRPRRQQTPSATAPTQHRQLINPPLRFHTRTYTRLLCPCRNKPPAPKLAHTQTRPDVLVPTNPSSHVDNTVQWMSHLSLLTARRYD